MAAAESTKAKRFVSHALANPPGRSLTGSIGADRLNAAARPGGRVAFGRPAGEHGGRGAAALQQAAKGQSHARRGRVSGGRRLGPGGPLAFPFTGLRPPLGGRGALQRHADGGRTRRRVGREGERG